VSENDLVERLLSGDRRALARIISRIEGEDPEVRNMISELYPHTGEATTVGFTGPPGVCKSSIIARLIVL
jgi:LAO/AO transport system kinase